MNRMMQEEFAALYQAIAVAVFLVLWYCQRSLSHRSFLHGNDYHTIQPHWLLRPLQITGVSISMTSILGFLILVGTVVNNGILYVDTDEPIPNDHGFKDSPH